MSTQVQSLADSYLRAINDHDAKAFLALFADDAVVDDVGRKFGSRDAIRNWSDREIFDAAVTVEVINVADRDGETTVTTKVDGNFDRTGLPDPVIINHHLAVERGKIVRLTCRLLCEMPAT
jgi:uncharacterized protein (TIGR02246 family)